MITLDLTSRVPIYEQLKDKITRLAISKAFEPHYKLPSVRSLARDLMVNPNTVQKAYQDLEREGIIYSVRGKGSFIAENIEKNLFVRNETLSALNESVKKCHQYGIDKVSVINVVEKIYDKEVAEK